MWEVRADGIAVNQQRANAEILSGGLSEIKFLFVLKALLGLAEVLNLLLMSPLRLLRASGLGSCVCVCVSVGVCLSKHVVVVVLAMAAERICVYVGKNVGGLFAGEV